MTLKDNQPILRDLIKNVFRGIRPLSSYSTDEKDPGREERHVCSVADTKLLVQKGLYEEWPGLQRIVRMERGRLCDDLRSKETVYYLSSEEKDDEMYTRPLGD